jgi:hypothetical protein
MANAWRFSVNVQWLAEVVFDDQHEIEMPKVASASALYCD